MRITFLFSICFLITTQALAQWTTIQSGTSADLTDVHFPTQSQGYIVSDNGVVLSSSDTGSTWQTIHSDSSYAFKSVFFTDADTGYSAGQNLYKTTNGGKNWVTVLTDSLNTFLEIYFVTSQTGYAGSASGIYKTTDGGNTWTKLISNAQISSIHFPSDSTGYFIGGSSQGDPLYKTADGGQSMTSITNGFQSIKEAVHFLNDTVGFMCGWYNGLLAKTADGGATWKQLDTINSPQCWDVHFFDEKTGYYIDNGGGSYEIKKTTNGGQTWTTQLSVENHYLNEFHFINNDVGIAIGDSGIIYKTKNSNILGINPSTPSLPLNIYPNPAKSTVNIDVQDIKGQSFKMEVYSSEGKQMRSFKFGEPTTTVDITDLSKGIYFLTITDNHQRKTIKRLMKK